MKNGIRGFMGVTLFLLGLAVVVGSVYFAANGPEHNCIGLGVIPGAIMVIFSVELIDTLKD